MKAQRCVDCKVRQEHAGMCDDCKAFNRLLRDIVGLRVDTTRTAEDQATIAANIERYTERASRGEPLFGGDQ